METPIWLVDCAWISFAFICGFIAKIGKFPPLIGFLAAGFLLNGLGIRQQGAALQELADLGVTLLLFTIGLKLDVKSLLRREIWLGTSLHMMISTVVLGGVVFLLTLTPLLGRVPFVTAVLILMGVGLLGGEIKPISMELGLICLGAGLSSALGGITAIGQGMTAGAAMGSVAKKPETLGQNMVLSVMSETFAVFALLIAILIMVGAKIM